MNMTVGTCSICGGRVTVPPFHHSIIPPDPTCESCGAIAAKHGPVIPMNPNPTRVETGGTSTKLEWNGETLKQRWDGSTG